MKKKAILIKEKSVSIAIEGKKETVSKAQELVEKK